MLPALPGMMIVLFTKTPSKPLRLECYNMPLRTLSLDLVWSIFHAIAMEINTIETVLVSYDTRHLYTAHTDPSTVIMIYICFQWMKLSVFDS